jgi:predicted alternative tryptophan synthase beta-subunit
MSLPSSTGHDCRQHGKRNYYHPDEKHVFENARLFAQTEGWLPAPESAYSIWCAIEEARDARDEG